jgi:hypothetical protein
VILGFTALFLFAVAAVGFAILIATLGPIILLPFPVIAALIAYHKKYITISFE